MSETTHPLTARERADMFRQLLQMEAGLSAQQAWQQLARTPGETGIRARTALRGIKRGQTIAVAGRRLFDKLDAALLEAAAASGAYAAVYQRLEQLYRQRASRARLLRSRLILPAVLGLLSFILAPIPDLAFGQINTFGYIWRALGIPVFLLATGSVLVRLPAILRGFGATGDRLVLGLPFFGPRHKRRQLQIFLHGLGLLLEAGLPMLEALPKACGLVSNPILRERLRFIRIEVENGALFSEALRMQEGFNSAALALAGSGEYSGSLDRMLLHYAQSEAEEIAREDDAFAAWLARAGYFAVAAWMAYAVFSNASLVFSSTRDILSHATMGVAPA